MVIKNEDNPDLDIEHVTIAWAGYLTVEKERPTE